MVPIFKIYLEFRIYTHLVEDISSCFHVTCVTWYTPACGHDQVVREDVVEDVVHELGGEHDEPDAGPVLNAHDADRGKISTEFPDRLLGDCWVRVPTLFSSQLWELFLHHDPAVTQPGSNISSVEGEVGQKQESPGPGVDKGPWKHQDSAPGHLTSDEDGCHPDSHPLGLHHLLRVHDGGDFNLERDGKCGARDARMSAPKLFEDSAGLESGR